MDTLTFISNTIGQVISWPVAIIGLGILFRSPIGERLKDIRKIKTKHFEANFGEELEIAEEKIIAAEAEITDKIPDSNIDEEPLPQTREELLEQLTELMPNAAILESWRNVERTLDYYFSNKGINMPKSRQSMLGHLDYDPNFTPQLVTAYQELRLLRNRAAHVGENISERQAKEFIALADRLTHALMSAVK